MHVDDAFQGENLVFLVGSPRSGTTWLQRLVASHPAVRTGQETHLFDFHIGPQLRKWSAAPAGGERGVGLGCYMYEQEYLEIVRRYMLNLLGPILAEVKPGEIFLEKTPAHAFFIREIHRFLPAARFIHLVRDPRDVVASLIAASGSWAAAWAPSDAGAAAALWVEHVKAARVATAALPAGHFLQLRYEDLHSGTREQLRRVTDFLNLSWTDAALGEAVEANTAAEAREGRGTRIPLRGEWGEEGQVAEPHGFVRRGRVAGWRKELSRRQQVVVRIVAAREMEALGYAPPSGRAAEVLMMGMRQAMARAIRRGRKDR